MGDLTTNISRSELVCQCGKCSVRILDDEPVIKLVQDCCDHFAKLTGVDKVVLHITSAARCQSHNKSIGSTDDSQHIRCQAMDIRIFSNGLQVSPKAVYDYFDHRFPDSCGVGLYPDGKGGFTHFDTRTTKARWQA